MSNEELTLLKERADKLGITYKGNIGVESLRMKVNAKLNDEPDPTDPTDNADPADTPDETPAAPKETVQETRTRQLAEQLKLVRIRVTCLNPHKAHMRGEMISTGNKYIGAVRKFVPFGEETDNGYHVPFIVYNELKERKFNSVKVIKGKNGTLLPQQRLVSEFAIEVLEPLTKDELEQLARQQAAAAGL